jgi:hypothetical protein
VRAQKKVYSILGQTDYWAMVNIICEYEKPGVQLLRKKSALLRAEIELGDIDSGNNRYKVRW